MRIKDLFTVPTGEKVTEKQLRRVLICSICSILLCMCCLASATWAWFTVSIQNENNVIHIGPPQITVTMGEQTLTSGSEFEAGTYELTVRHGNEEDDLDKKCDLNVTMTLADSEHGPTTKYITLNADNDYKMILTVEAKTSSTLTWEVSWFVPDGAEQLEGNQLTLTAPQPTEPETTEPENTTPPTEAPTGAPTEPETTEPETTQQATEPVESNQTETTATTDPVEETTSAEETA